MLEVVAALIVQEGRFLLCQRPAHKARGGLWEFAGGKVEPGETHREALARECREELGADIAVGDAVVDVTHAYPDLTVHLTLFEAHVCGAQPRRLEHQAICWVTPQEAEAYALCPADREMMDEIGNRIYGLLRM